MPGGKPYPQEVYDERVRCRLKACSTVSASGCWEWQGFLHSSGYGGSSYRNVSMKVHRISYIVFKGPIPKGHDVCHTCDNRRCINPTHLWTGPRGDNNRDTRLKGRDNNSQKTHCPRGHAYAEHGRHVKAGFKGWRACRICARGNLRMRSGWPEHLAYTVPPIPPNQKTERRRAGMLKSE